MHNKEQARKIVERQDSMEVAIFQALSWAQLFIPVALVIGNMWLLYDVCASFADHYKGLEFSNFFIPGLFSSLSNMYIPFLIEKSRLNADKGEPARSDGGYAVTFVLFTILGITSPSFSKSERRTIISLAISSALIQIYLLWTAIKYSSGDVSVELIENLVLRVFVSVCLDIMAGNYSISMLMRFENIAKGGNAKPIETVTETEPDTDTVKKPQPGPQVQRNLPMAVDRGTLREMVRWKGYEN